MPVLKEQGSASSKPAASPSPAQRARAAVIDWFTDGKGAAPAGPAPAAVAREGVIDWFNQNVAVPKPTTAGEVQGQGPYPGIPGYSALDNWNRSEANGTYSAPGYAEQLLEQAGYAKPKLRGTGRQSIQGLDLKAAEELTPYTYRVNEDEARDILQAYAPGSEGDPAALSKQRVEKKNRAVPMTVEAYNKLTPEQKAAVDFNTALVEAREKDMMGGWMIKVPSPDSQSAEFRKAVFGEDAPTGGNPENVLRVLERIGFKAPGTARLEDFMSLDMAITAEELKDLKLPKDINVALGRPKSETQQPTQGREINPFTGKPDENPFDQVSSNDYGRARSAENLAMMQLDVIRRASETIAKARENNQSPAWSPASTAASWLGEGMRDEKTPFGWGYARDRSRFTNDAKDLSKDDNFRKIFEILQSDTSKTKLADSEAFWARLKETGYDEKDIDQLFEFLDQRTRMMLQNGEKPAQGLNDAAIIRELAGLEPVNGG